MYVFFVKYFKNVALFCLCLNNKRRSTPRALLILVEWTYLWVIVLGIDLGVTVKDTDIEGAPSFI